MRILEYTGLDTTGVATQYQRVTEAIARGDFRSAQVKKLKGPTHTALYRAKLDAAGRLLFTLVKSKDETCALILEVIPNHNYARSRFLRGATIDESRIPDIDAAAAAQEAQPVRYLNPQARTVHFLNKPLSFDDTQEAVHQLPPPLIVAGSAGSGKTALMLEKLKDVSGEVLYVTQSPDLAQNARDLYYGGGFEREGQEATFVSYREFLESIRVPDGREATWRDFSVWLARMRQGQAFKGIDAHQAFEEIRGVLTAQAGGVLAREAYLALGMRQSIFPADGRGRLYDLFERYQLWLAESGLYDVNLVAHEWLALAGRCYDFVVVDEVQDLTMAQLALVLATLKQATRFMLCGDSNQIVHPNFFSWAQVKSLFWHDPELAARQELRVLSTNYRNSIETTDLANTLLKIKQQRFGSIDRETNLLVRPVGANGGEAALLPDKPEVKRELDRRTRESTQFAVLVMRDEDKAAAREHFATPLLFSIHEVKGLEYENIVLHGFVSAHRREFAEIAAGVTAEDLDVDELEYRRARDKTDKSLEVYKFFVNALYVALTRAVKNVYLIESDAEHPLLKLLGLSRVHSEVQVEARQSSLGEWQSEARKLELQGKQDQADSIRRTLLKQTPPPWPVLREPEVRELLKRVFSDQPAGSESLRRLSEYAGFHNLPPLTAYIARETGFGAVKGVCPDLEIIAQKHGAITRRLLEPYSSRNIEQVLRQCDAHGIEHRTPMGQTPLMAAAMAGNLALVEALLERGADREATDDYGCNALHIAMRTMFSNENFAKESGAALYECLAPAHVDVKVGGRLVRIDKRLSVYFLFQTHWAVFRSLFTRARNTMPAVDSKTMLLLWESLPENLRAHISSAFSPNEVERDYVSYGSLFKNVGNGRYHFNPALEVRYRTSGGEDIWKPLFLVLNLPLIRESSFYAPRFRLTEFLRDAGLPACPEPIMTQRETARQQAMFWGLPFPPGPKPVPWGCVDLRLDSGYSVGQAGRRSSNPPLTSA